MSDDPLGTLDDAFDVQRYGLSAVVYAERGDKILVLKRAGGLASREVVEVAEVVHR